MIFCQVVQELKHFWIPSNDENEIPFAEIDTKKTYIKLWRQGGAHFSKIQDWLTPGPNRD